MRIGPAPLLDFATAIYAAAGMPDTDARLVADTLVQADLWGHQSHGVLRLPWYSARLQAGVMHRRRRAEVCWSTPARVAVIDGHDGDGPGADRPRHGGCDPPRQGARHRRGRRAQLQPFRHGACTTRCRRRATAASRSSRPTPARRWRRGAGGRRSSAPIPWSLAAPAGQARADGARHRQHRRRARQDLPGQAEGRADPARLGDRRRRARRPPIPPRRSTGVILPMAGHKGYAIAVMMDVLSGVLTGSAVRQRRARPVPDRAPQRRGAADDRARHRGVPAAGRVQRAHGAADRRAEGGAAGRGLRRDLLSGRDGGAHEAANRREGCCCPTTRWKISPRPAARWALPQVGAEIIDAPRLG